MGDAPNRVDPAPAGAGPSLDEDGPAVAEAPDDPSEANASANANAVAVAAPTSDATDAWPQFSADRTAPLDRTDEIAAAAEQAADACRNAAARLERGETVATDEGPVPVRKGLGPRQLTVAARLYDNAAFGARHVPEFIGRDYPGDRRWAVTQAARATSQLLEFLRYVAGDDRCPVQNDVFSVLDQATKQYRIHVPQGMRWDEPVDHRHDDRTRRSLEIAAEGRTPADEASAKLLRALAYDLDQLDGDRAFDVERMIAKVDATVAELMAAPHELRPRDPRLGRVAGLVDDVEFDEETYPAIARIADADSPGAPRPGESPRPFDEIFAEHAERWDGRLVLAPNSRSDRGYRYDRPKEVVAALDWLAGDWRDAKLGRLEAAEGSPADLDEGLRAATGWFYRGHQSSTTVGRFRDWYRTKWEGRNYDVLSHIGRGNTRRQASKSIRVAFAWDAEREVVVIGFVGQHQRTTQS